MTTGIHTINKIPTPVICCLVVIASIVSFSIGGRMGVDVMQHQAVDAGVAFYNPATKEFTWGQPKYYTSNEIEAIKKNKLLNRKHEKQNFNNMNANQE